MFVPFSARAKAWESKGLALREVAGVGPASLLDPWQLATKVGLTVADGRAAVNSLGKDDRVHLLGAGHEGWSGGVYPKPLPDGTYLCILNPTHSRRRNKITLMEEISHTYLKHKPSGLLLVADGITVRYYDKGQEEEGYGVGAAALLPWQSFFPAINAGRTIAELAGDYEVTRALIEYRIKITGASRLYKARQGRHT